MRKEFITYSEAFKMQVVEEIRQGKFVSVLNNASHKSSLSSALMSLGSLFNSKKCRLILSDNGVCRVTSRG